MTRKALNFKTNYNAKLGADYIVHLDVAPSNRVSGSLTRETVFVINTLDHSYPACEYQLDDITRCKLGEITSTMTRLSHGMTRPEYLIFISDKNYTPETEMALYFYKKFISQETEQKRTE